MGFDFLHQYGGRRLRHTPPQPPMDPTDHEDEADKASAVEWVEPPGDWEPIPVTREPFDPELMPRRFIDGCHAGETIAWLQDREGHPIPVRLAEIGGVCMRLEGRALRREFAIVQRVVSLIVEPFPWHEVEAFSAELAVNDFRLLPAPPPRNGKKERVLSFHFEPMREQPRQAAQHAMHVLEELALSMDTETPSLIDNRLGGYFEKGLQPRADVVGVIKSHHKDYLNDQGWQTFYRLEPGQRTPAFRVRSKHLAVATWYLKLDGSNGELPNWGVVRVEVPWAQFERHGSDSKYLNQLSHALQRLRCRQGSYGRAPVSLEPIVRAEENLKALFGSLNALQHHFFRVAGL